MKRSEVTLNAFDRILRGDPGKQSRFRDFEGRRPPLVGWLYLLPSLASTVRFKLTGKRPIRPWLGYRATRRIAELVGRDTKVLEFGSGLSTVWFARRGARVLSFEAREDWRRYVESLLAIMPSHKARVVLAKPPYGGDLVGDQRFDFALVDGEARDSSMAIALAAVRPGGWIYLDNADVRDSAHQAARRLLLASGPAEWFTDFTPSHVFVSTGVLVRKI